MGVQYNTIENVPVASFETSWKNESANQPIKSVVAEITPTQDLHGYDYPWPAGGGANMFNPETVAVGYVSDITGEINSNQTDSRASDYIAVLSDTSYYIANSAASGRWGAWYDENKTYISACNGVGVRTSPSNAKYMRITVSHSNNNPDFANNVMVAKSSSDVPFSPYSNICPITGRTEATVTRAGVNLLPCGEAFNITRNGIVFTSNGNGTYTVKGTAENTAAYKFPIAETVLPNEVYVHLGNNAINGNVTLAFFHNNTNIVYFAPVTSINRILRSPSLDNQTVNALQLYVVKDATIDLTISPMIMTVSTATPFSPYSGTTYPVSWQSEVGTVYGGTVDVVSGVLTVEWATTDLGLYTWNYSESAGAFYCGISTMKYYSSQTPIISALCSAYPNVGKPYLELGDKQLTTNMYGFSNSQKYCIIKDSAYTDAAEFKAAMSGIQLVYALATPQTYQLSGQHNIKTLLGLNNVWADSGNIKKLMWQYTIFDLLRVFINGFEITDFIAFGGWQRERGDVDGPEAGRTLDARMHRARVATKMRYNVTCRPLLVEELSSLERLIMPEYVTVKVVGDPYYGTWEKTCYVNNTSSQYLIRKRNGAQWWGGITFPIIEV